MGINANSTVGVLTNTAESQETSVFPGFASPAVNPPPNVSGGVVSRGAESRDVSKRTNMVNQITVEPEPLTPGLDPLTPGTADLFDVMGQDRGLRSKLTDH